MAIELPEKDNVIQMRPKLSLLTGDGPPPGTDWLSEMEVGTIFLCKAISPDPRQRVVFLESFEVVYKHKKAIRIRGTDTQTYHTVLPAEFCRIMAFVEIISE